MDTTDEMVLLDGLLHLKLNIVKYTIRNIELPDNLLEYDIPVGRREDHEEPGADENDPSHLHVTEHNLIHQYVIG